MQFTQADSNTSRVGVQEELIKFRPSPNFKNMKKFLKSRNSYAKTLQEQNGSRQPLLEQNVHRQPLAEQSSPRQPSPTPQSQPQQKPEQKAEVKPAVVQPPLPPYPPPPDSPPNLNIIIKQEREDEDDTLQNSERQPSPSLNQTVQEISERPQTVKKTMCKEFIRGDCKRSVCRFSHELDLSQLPGVFTFCWNYQNTKCTYPYCKFVHATVWEEANFYRTGILPPHARSHMKKAPPPPPPSNDGSNYVTAMQQPPMHPGLSMDKPMEPRHMADYPSISARSNSPLKQEWSGLDECNGPSKYVASIQNPPTHPGPGMEQRQMASYPSTSVRSRSPLKRDWSALDECNGPSKYVASIQHPPTHPGPSMEQRQMASYPSTSVRSRSPLTRDWSALDEFSSSPRDLETEPLAKKCKNCEFLEFRLQYYKEKIDGMMQAREEINKKTAALNKKSNKLSLVLLTLMKPGNNLKAGSVASGSLGGDKEKAMLEQLGHFINTSNRLSGPGERDDTVENAYGGNNNNISNLMAKIFCGNSDQTLTVDTSRET